MTDYLIAAGVAIVASITVAFFVSLDDGDER